METTTPAPQSWADDSAFWAESVGNNTAREIAPDKNPATLFPETPDTAPASREASENGCEYDMELPEGMTADADLLEEFAGLAKESNLPPAAARKILDLEVKNVQRQLEAFTRRQSAWRDEIAKDPEFGGIRLETTVSHARRALKTYDPDGTLLPELNRAGYGNHPGIIRFLARVGGRLGEDTAFSSRDHIAREKRPLRDRLWPD